MQITITKFIIFLLSILVILDSLNGYLIFEFSLSITPLIKMGLLVLMISMLLKKRIYTPLVNLLLLLFLNLFHLIAFQDSSGLFLGITWPLKFSLILTTYYFIIYFIKTDNNALSEIKRIILISFAVLSLNLLLGLLGFGYETYARQGIGHKGLFKAGNEVALLIINLEFIILVYLIRAQRIVLYLLFSGIFLLLSVILATKTAIIGVVILIITIPIINLLTTLKNLKSIFPIVFFFVAFIVSGPLLFTYTMKSFNLESRYGKYFKSHNEDAIDDFYGAREDWVDVLLNYQEEKGNTFTYLFGNSYSTMIEVAEKTSENDLVDIFFIFGFIGVILTYGFFIKNLFLHVGNLFRRKIFEKTSLFAIYYILLMLIISMTTGHVIMSTISGTTIAIILALLFYQLPIINKEK